MAIVRPDQSSGGGGGGGVQSVTAGDTSIVVGGTAANPTVETAPLDVIAADHATGGDVALNAHKITGLANGTAATDAAAFGQLPLTAGLSELIYRYTVTGSAKASIDTGVDASQAGSNDWTNGDVLEVMLISRSTAAVILAGVNFRFNNDSGASYWRGFVATSAVSTTPIAGMSAAAETAVLGATLGANAAANLPGCTVMTVPGYSGTTFAKSAFLSSNCVNTVSANADRQLDIEVALWNNTAAITRLAALPDAGNNLVVGTTLYVYKRRMA